MKILVFSASFILLLFNNIGFVENANILAIFSLPSKSHFVMFERVLKGLAQRGHQVDVYSHFPLKKPMENYNDISLVGSQPILVNNLTLDQVKRDSFLDLIDFMLVTTGTEACKINFEMEQFRELRNTSKKYDVLLTEIFNTECMWGFGHLLKIPIIAFTSSVNLPWGSDRFANPDNPAYIPTYFTDFTPRMTLMQRLQNTISLISAKVLYQIKSVNVANKLSKEFFGPDLPDINDLIYNTSLLLVNSHFSMNQIRPNVPGFVEVGGVHIQDPKPLNQYFDKVLNHEGTKGIIYLSMGSMIKTEAFEPKIIQAIFDAFAQMPYKILWKANKDNFPKNVVIPKNIHFEKWMPQLDILCDPRVKLFVSHGGLMGSQEATYCGVPRLGIPLFADQELNIRQSINMGTAVKLALEDITKDTMLKALTELLSTNKFTEKAKEHAKLFKDRPMTPLDTALYWIEYVIRHNGAPHLKSVATELYWYQYYLLDVGDRKSVV